MPTTSETVIEQVQAGEIPAHLSAIKEAKQAERRAREAEQAARVEAQTMQQQLLEMQASAASQIEQLGEHIRHLQQQITTLTTPPIEIREIERVPATVLSQVEALQREVRELTTQRNNLSEKARKLGEEAQQAVLKRHEEEKDRATREAWHKTAREFQAAILKALAQLPTPVDLLAFEVLDWEHLTHMKELARRFLASCDQLTTHSNVMIVDADTTDPSF